MKKQIKVIHK